MSREDEKKPVEILESLQTGRIGFSPGSQSKPNGRMLEPWMHGQGALHTRISVLEEEVRALKEDLGSLVEVASLLLASAEPFDRAAMIVKGLVDKYDFTK